MKVKIGDKVYFSVDQPILVILSDDDKANISNMHPDSHLYCSFPDGTDIEEVKKFMDLDRLEDEPER